ncbi:MAG: hypothetical protein LBU84_16680 [Prevotella sp.]|nr:hypothetical protein [Prevotella sp.]
MINEKGNRGTILIYSTLLIPDIKNTNWKFTIRVAELIVKDRDKPSTFLANN